MLLQTGCGAGVLILYPQKVNCARGDEIQIEAQGPDNVGTESGGWFETANFKHPGCILCSLHQTTTSCRVLEYKGFFLMLESIITHDVELFKWINSQHSLFLDYLFRVLTNLGNGFYLAPILISLVVWKIRRRQVVQVIVLCTIGMSLAGVVNNHVKEVVGRSRPLGIFVPNWDSVPQDPDKEVEEIDSMYVYNVHAPGEQLYARAFPSGHTNTAFAGATVLFVVLGKAYWWAFIFAFLVGYSRIYLGVHFPADTVVGAAMGTSVTALVVVPGMRLFRKRQAASDKSRHEQMHTNADARDRNHSDVNEHNREADTA